MNCERSMQMKHERSAESNHKRSMQMKHERSMEYNCRSL